MSSSSMTSFLTSNIVPTFKRVCRRGTGSSSREPPLLQMINEASDEEEPRSSFSSASSYSSASASPCAIASASSSQQSIFIPPTAITNITNSACSPAAVSRRVDDSRSDRHKPSRHTKEETPFVSITVTKPTTLLEPELVATSPPVPRPRAYKSKTGDASHSVSARPSATAAAALAPAPVVAPTTAPRLSPPRQQQNHHHQQSQKRSRHRDAPSPTNQPVINSPIASPAPARQQQQHEQRSQQQGRHRDVPQLSMDYTAPSTTAPTARVRCANSDLKPIPKPNTDPKPSLSPTSPHYVRVDLSGLGVAFDFPHPPSPCGTLSPAMVLTVSAVKGIRDDERSPTPSLCSSATSTTQSTPSERAVSGALRTPSPPVPASISDDEDDDDSSFGEDDGSNDGGRDDDAADALQLRRPWCTPRRLPPASVRPLTIVKSNFVSRVVLCEDEGRHQDLAEVARIEKQCVGEGEGVIHDGDDGPGEEEEQEQEEQEEGEEAVVAWYARELHEAFVVESPMSVSMPARRESLSLTPLPSPKLRGTASGDKALPALPVPVGGAAASFDSGAGGNDLVGIAPVTRTRAMVPMAAAPPRRPPSPPIPSSRGKRSRYSVRPPPRMSIPADVHSLDVEWEAMIVGGGGGGGYDNGVGCGNVSDERGLSLDVHIPVSLSPSPTMLGLGFVVRSPVEEKGGWGDDDDCDGVSTWEKEEEEDGDGDGQVVVLRSRWSTSTLGSPPVVEERHTGGSSAARMARFYFGGSQQKKKTTGTRGATATAAAAAAAVLTRTMTVISPTPSSTSARRMPTPVPFTSLSLSPMSVSSSSSPSFPWMSNADSPPVRGSEERRATNRGRGRV